MSILPSSLIPSPCVGVCRMDAGVELCLGCARSSEEVAIWRDISEAKRREIWAQLPGRFGQVGLKVGRLPWIPDEILSFAADRLRGREGGWTMGCYGAVAEFRIEDGEPGEVEIRGGTITARTDRGAFRLTVDGSVRALALYEAPGALTLRAVILVLPRIRAGIPRAAGLEPLGADRTAIRPDEQDHSLYDLGLSRGTTRFCVRAGQPDLIAALDGVAGRPWQDAMRSVGDKIRQANPVRVVETALGRIEVRTPIPSQGNLSPSGPHTHLLPDLLALGHEVAPDVELPKAYAAGAIFYPSPPADA
jgi:predicted Fe-S protein YdhL (DUF1289 family)